MQRNEAFFVEIDMIALNLVMDKLVYIIFSLEKHIIFQTWLILKYTDAIPIIITREQISVSGRVTGYSTPNRNS